MEGSNFSTISTGVVTTSTDISSSGRRSPSSLLGSSHLHPNHLQDSLTEIAGTSRSRRQNPAAHARSISSSSVSSSGASRKGRHVEPGTSEIHADSLPFSSQPQSPKPLKSPLHLLPRSRCHSTTSIQSDEADVASQRTDDSVTPRVRADSHNEAALYALLPEPALTARSSLSDVQSRRLSGNSVYSLASARSAVSHSNVEPSGPPRSVPSLMTSGKTPPSAQSEPGVSNVTVTTSSSTSSGLHSTGAHNLAPRDPHAQPLDLMRRNQRSDASTNSNMRPQPDRSRSRAKRRFSGSTVNSSHSPSSERGHLPREKEEGTLRIAQYMPVHLYQNSI
jgi:hypothetical protein